MSEVGKTCLWTVSVAPEWPPVWCGKKGAGVRTVPARDGKPAYEATLCSGHLQAFDRGESPEGVQSDG